MPSRTTDCRLLCGEEHAREIFAICASLRRTAEGDCYGSPVPAVLRTGCTQVLHHCLCSAAATVQTAKAAFHPVVCIAEAVTKLLAGSAASMARCGWGEGWDSSKGCSGAGDAVSGDLGELIS